MRGVGVVVDVHAGVRETLVAVAFRFLVLFVFDALWWPFFAKGSSRFGGRSWLSDSRSGNDGAVEGRSFEADGAGCSGRWNAFCC